MVSKLLIYRKVYENINSINDIPNLTIEDIIKILEDIPLVSDYQKLI